MLVKSGSSNLVQISSNNNGALFIKKKKITVEVKIILIIPIV